MPPNKIEVQVSNSENDLIGIKALISENHLSNLSISEQNQEGFVTINYSLENLKILHKIIPAIIAVENGHVIGYALAATKKSIGINPMLDDLIRFTDSIDYNSNCLADVPYIIVGQLCVAKTNRRQKVAQKIYQVFREVYEKKFVYCITSIDQNNQGSINAHLLCGFKVIRTTTYKEKNYSLVIWDWSINR